MYNPYINVKNSGFLGKKKTIFFVDGEKKAPNIFFKFYNIENRTTFIVFICRLSVINCK